MEAGMGSAAGWMFLTGAAALSLWAIWMGLMGLSAPHAPREARPAAGRETRRVCPGGADPPPRGARA